jgi:DNA-binding NarL/FixJ family response regulator
MLRVVIADDQPIIRDGLKLIIEQDNDIKVIGSAVNGKEAFELSNVLKPDIVLMDVVMPVCDGIEGTRLIKEKNSNIKVAILTTYIEEDKITIALQNGADGYIFKDMESEDLILAVKSIAKGLKVLHRNAYDTVLKKILPDEPYVSGKSAKINELTERELEVIRLIVYGKSYKEVSSSLFLSEGSIRNIISGILTKLDLKDRVQLAVFAIKNNII